MISFGPLSLTLLFGSLQGLILACLLFTVPTNKGANRFLALLIMAVASMITPYTIGFAGFYDAYPWLSFAPFATSLSFGPLLYFYAFRLTGGQLPKHWWLHFVPYFIQFLNQALVFPLPIATKNWWDGVAYAYIISPTLTVAALVSVAVYGAATWRRYRTYYAFLENTRTDGVRFDPSWIAHVLIALCAMALVWSGFAIADAMNPERTYFDRFWMYVGLSLLAIYLGVEGRRNAHIPFPVFDLSLQAVAEPQRDEGRSWGDLASALNMRVDQDQLWRDPDITVASLARALATNTGYISRALNEGMGVSFSTFINQKRVAALKAKLSEPSESRDLLTLAFEFGFNSKASFNRAFSEYTGMSPSAYRRASHSKADR